MNDVVSERLCILLAKRSRTRRFNLATREPPPKDIVLAARVYADNGPHLVVVGRDCHPRSPDDIENSEIAGALRLAACLSVRIVRSQHYYGEAPHTLGLLRAHRERPPDSRA